MKSNDIFQNRQRHLVCAKFKQQPDDFYVEEILPFEFSKSGEHLFVFVEKRLLTTLDTLKILSQWANVPRKNISYSGLKDKYACARQWFSIWLPGKPTPNIDDLGRYIGHEDLRLIEHVRHNKKLRVGAHTENFFKLVIRDISDTSVMIENLKGLENAGVPNYFGEQRFGHDRHNLQAAREVFLTSKKRVDKKLKGIYLSAVRSFLFNKILSNRISQGVWDQYLEDDVIQLSGSQSYFIPELWDETLQQRLENKDINLTAPLYGAVSQKSANNYSSVVQGVLHEHTDWVDFLEKQVSLSYRSLRVFPRSLLWNCLDNETIELSFYLSKGAFATSVLRELIKVEDPKPYQRL